MKTPFKKLYRDVCWMLFCTLIMIAIIFCTLPPRVTQAEINALQESEEHSVEDIPAVSIRQDSLLKLLDYFAIQNNSGYTADTSSDTIFSLKLQRFSSTPSTFFCNNSSLPGKSNQEFKLEVNKSNGEINAWFVKQKIAGIYYVKLPTDVLCGLIKQHPNIR